MLGRLFFAIHWVLFAIFVGLWFIWFLAGLEDDDMWAKVTRDFLRELQYKRDTSDFVSAALMTWIPVLFFFIDYVVHGEWTWFPWERSKD